MANGRIGFKLSVLLSVWVPLDSALGDQDSVRLFAQQPAMVGAQLSPDGRRIAFLSSLQGRYHLVVEQFNPSFSRAILSAGDELEFNWVRWANDDRLVVSASFAGRRFLTETTETRLLSVDAGANSLTPLIRPGKFKETGSRVAKELPPPQIQDNVVDWLIEEPNHILVAVDSDLNDIDEVRRVDIRNGKYSTVLDHFPAARTWLTDSSGKLRLGWAYEANEVVVTLQNSDGDWADSRDKVWSRQRLAPLAFTNDPDILLVRDIGVSGLAVVRKLNLATDELMEIVFEHERVDAQDAVLDPVSGSAVGVSYTDHLPATAYFDTAMIRLQSSIDKALPGMSNAIMSMSTNRMQILIYSRSDQNPGAYFIWDREGKSLSHYSDTIPGMNDDLISPVEATHYIASDGLKIPAYLTLPLGTDGKSLPAVVLPHGGPEARDDKSYWFLSQFLASQGYAVLQPNFRGSSGYGYEFADAGNNEWGGKMQDDLSDGARWLIDQGIADADRICIVGWSYGGYAAAMGAIKTPNLYRCAASINGVLNLPRLILDDQKYVGGSEWTRHIGLEGETSKAVSPVHQAERILVPMLIIQAEDDTRVHKDQGRRMAERLRELGKQVQYVELPSGGHSISNVEARAKVLTSLDAFLTQNIGPDVAAE